MAWIAIAGDSPVKGDRIVTTVRLTNGTKTVDVPVPNDGTLAGLQAAVRALIAQRTAPDGDPVQIVAPGTILDLTPPPGPPPPTQAELDRAAWFQDWRTYQSYQRGIAANLPGMTATTPAVANLKASLDAGFKASYAGSL